MGSSSSVNYIASPSNFDSCCEVCGLPELTISANEKAAVMGRIVQLVMPLFEAEASREEAATKIQTRARGAKARIELSHGWRRGSSLEEVCAVCELLFD